MSPGQVFSLVFYNRLRVTVQPLGFTRCQNAFIDIFPVKGYSFLTAICSKSLYFGVSRSLDFYICCQRASQYKQFPFEVGNKINPACFVNTSRIPFSSSRVLPDT